MNRSILSVVALLVSLAPAQAQRVGRLHPTGPLPGPGGQLEVQLLSGEGAATRIERWPAPEKRNWLFLRAPGTQSNIAEVPTSGSPATRARLDLPLGEYGNDGVVVGLDLGVRIEPVTPANWQRFLLERTGLAQSEQGLPPLAAGAPPVRVRRLESMKLLVRPEGGDRVRTPSAVLMAKTGQAVELRPLADPTTVSPGSDLPLSVYTITGETRGLTITALHEPSGATTQVVTGLGGMAHVRITAAGRWTLEMHQVLELNGAWNADFEVRSATLSFVAPAAETELTTPRKKTGARDDR